MTQQNEETLGDVRANLEKIVEELEPTKLDEATDKIISTLNEINSVLNETNLTLKDINENGKITLEDLKDYIFGKDRAKIIPCDEEMKLDHLFGDVEANLEKMIDDLHPPTTKQVLDNLQ